MALFPIEDRTDEGSEDIYLLYESFNRAGDGVITIVASIKPWCHEWRAYWKAYPARDDGWGFDDDGRFEDCKRNGHKVDEDVARAMFSGVEAEYGVHWKA